MDVGYALASETTPPGDLVEHAQRAEQAGLTTVSVSDHFHPWTKRQGESPMVWAVLGAVASGTSVVKIGTAVTCPILRTHPAIVAHGAATVAAMAKERFFLGVGTGENLNEHVLGQPWPDPEERLDRLVEAVDVMRQLWTGEKITSKGRYYDVDRAQLFTLPSRPPPVYVSAFGPKALRVAGEIGDGLIGTSPDKDTVAGFDEHAGRQLPKVSFDKVCWGPDEAECRKVLHDLWPTSGLKGQLAQELPTPELFEDAVAPLSEDDVVGSTPCGPDVEPYLRLLRAYADAGYTTVCLNQVGPDVEGWFRFWETELEPAWRDAV
jgi:coenzyme F420-dependent glucose-6-phosphate dehydrogenase